jgi:prepilin-type N-terminal cleavage/methylation domain-containing protein
MVAKQSKMKFNPSTPGNPRASSRAFTLIEVMMACVISSIIFLGLFYGISQGYDLIKSTRENLRATQILVGRLEGLRLENWNQVNSLTYVPNTFTDFFYPVGLGGFASNSVVYTGSMVVATMPGNFSAPNYSTAMREVTVKVGWQDIHQNYRGTTTNSFVKTLKTYVSQNGVQNYVYNPPLE